MRSQEAVVRVETRRPPPFTLKPPEKVEVARAFEVMTPWLSILKSVVVAVPEELAIMKRFVAVSPLCAKSENFAHGVDVPMPRLLVKTVVPEKVEEAWEMRPLAKVWSADHVLAVLVFGSVEDEPMNQVALVVENARPWFRERKFCAEVVLHRHCVASQAFALVVEKKLRVSFHASALVVEKELAR